jgi:hypothetical protein
MWPQKPLWMVGMRVFSKYSKVIVVRLMSFERLFPWEKRCINSANKIAENPPDFIWCDHLILIQK